MSQFIILILIIILWSLMSPKTCIIMAQLYYNTRTLWMSWGFSLFFSFVVAWWIIFLETGFYFCGAPPEEWSRAPLLVGLSPQHPKDSTQRLNGLICLDIDLVIFCKDSYFHLFIIFAFWIIKVFVNLVFVSFLLFFGVIVTFSTATCV